MTARYRVRWLELLLLVVSGGIQVLGFVLLSVAQHRHLVTSDLRYPVVFIVSTIALSLWLGRAAPGADQFLLPVVTLLTGVGILMVTRLDSGLGHRQVLWTLAGELAIAIVLALPRSVTQLRLYKYTWASIGLLLIVLTILGGTDINGSGYRRWIGFHGVYFQPVELLKILIAVFFAAYLDEKHELLASARIRLKMIRLPPFQYLAPLVLVWGLSLALLVKQNDLGSALLFLGIFLAMIYVGTARAVYPVTGIAMFVVGAIGAFHLFPHVRDRTEVWLNPFAHSSTTGFQLVQGLIALSSGGIGGQGLGLGMPYKVPVVTTDFILAAIGEELGLAGVVCLLALLLFLVFRGLTIGIGSEDGFQKLLATGLVATIAIQTIVIVGGTTRLMPLTGVPLPFLSYGGSSALADFLMIGLLLKISAEAGTVP
ncbi:MAG TPA: FtsW/RodA/SpoVE family cell cycle protein [Chloroflexota bacterium]|nr:FtsW/RodA/SpoVE family cell cycle protein [Chloroflexota bacterium]